MYGKEIYSDSYFSSSLISRAWEKDSQEVSLSKQNTLNSCKEVMALFLLRSFHAMNCCIY